MSKQRSFQKKITVSNYRSVSKAVLDKTTSIDEGKPLKNPVEILVEIYYTPRGYYIDIHCFDPIEVWDQEHTNKLYGQNASLAEGTIFEKHFDTQLAAMHFITKRFKSLGWTATSKWEDS